MMQKNPDSQFHFSFHAFLSVYSALRILKPTKIYIHSDFNDTMISQARERGSKWTRTLLNSFPEVIQINPVPVITHANGHEMKDVEHRSDMVRFDQIYQKGGIYMDFDVLTLRDARPLREVGFYSIVGRQNGGEVNNGCFMGQKGSALAFIMKRDQWTTYDGGWTTHSVALLTRVAERLARAPNEVLILDKQSLAGAGFDDGSVDWTYAVHATTVPQFPQVNDLTEDPIERWDNRVRSQEWEQDYSSTYFLHAFKTHGGRKIPGFKGVSVKYLMDRNSNFALAASTILQIGLEEGIFEANDEEL